METTTVYYKNDPTDIVVYLNESDYVSKIIRWNHIFYEWNLLEYIDTHYHDQHTILDIGANIGNHSLFFAKYLNYEHIYAFEPMRKNIELFQQNLEKYKDKCTFFETALGSKEDTLPLFNTSEHNSGGYSLVQQPASFQVDSIPVKTLDSFHLEHISLIKIDVENFEADVLKGGKETIMKSKPLILLENSYHYFSDIFPNPEPHKEIMEELNYEKIHSNLCNSGMDVWTSAVIKANL